MRTLVAALLLSSPTMAADLPFPLDPSVSTFHAWSAGHLMAGDPHSCAFAVQGDRLTFEVIASHSAPTLRLAVRSARWPVPIGDPVTMDLWAGWDHVLAQAPSSVPHGVVVSDELSDGIGTPVRPIGEDVIDGFAVAARNDEADLRVEAVARSDNAEEIGEDLPRAGLAKALSVFEVCRVVRVPGEPS